MTTQRQFIRQPGIQQLALLTPLEGAAPSLAVPTDLTSRAHPVRRLPATDAQLTLVRAEGLPPQLRLDHRTRTIGRAGIAELRRILAEGGEAARAA